MDRITRYRNKTKLGYDICKDHGLTSPNVYIDRGGQGCATIWFNNVPAAKQALIDNNCVAITGANLVNCKYCKSHYSIKDKEYNMYPDFLCHEAKERFAEVYNKKFNKENK